MSMFRAFCERRPWAATIIGLLTGPVTGFLYLNRGKLAFISLLLIVLFSALPFALAHYLSFNPGLMFNVVQIATNIIAAVLCYKIAKYRVFQTPKWYARWYSLVFLFFLLPMAGVIGFRTWFYEPFHVPSQSMAPTINQSDYFYANKHAYYDQLPQRGDIVLFRSPAKPSVIFVKRIIGLPGDNIILKNGAVYLNGSLLPRKQIADFYNPSTHQAAMQFTEILPEGKEIRILQTQSAGPADNTPTYTVPAEHYFVLGDNRDNSRDSRFQDMGYIPLKNIVGKAAVIWWNSATYKFTYQPIN